MHIYISFDTGDNGCGQLGLGTMALGPPPKNSVEPSQVHLLIEFRAILTKHASLLIGYKALLNKSRNSIEPSQAHLLPQCEDYKINKICKMHLILCKF